METKERAWILLGWLIIGLSGALVWMAIWSLTGCTGIQTRAESISATVDNAAIGASRETFKACLNYQCNWTRIGVMREYLGNNPELEACMSMLCTNSPEVVVP